MTAPAFCLGLALCLVAPPAWASVPTPSVWRAHQDPSAPRDEAAEAFAAGEAAFAAGEFDTAVEAFSRAQTLLPHPHTAYNLGLAQARAGRPLEAWTTFTALSEQTDDPEQREEALRQRLRLAPAVARLRIDAPEGQAVLVDGARIRPGEEVLREPGPATVTVGGRRLDVQLEGGELRVLDVRRQRSSTPPPRRDPAQTGVLAAALVLAAGTAATGTAAALTDDDDRVLRFTTAGLGGATAILAATALGLHLRARKRGSS